MTTPNYRFSNKMNIANAYGTSLHLINKELVLLHNKQVRENIDPIPIKGKCTYTPRQVALIVEHLGEPTDIFQIVDAGLPNLKM